MRVWVQMVLFTEAGDAREVKAEGKLTTCEVSARQSGEECNRQLNTGLESSWGFRQRDSLMGHWDVDIG